MHVCCLTSYILNRNRCYRLDRPIVVVHIDSISGTAAVRQISDQNKFNRGKFETSLKPLKMESHIKNCLLGRFFLLPRLTGGNLAEILVDWISSFFSLSLYCTHTSFSLCRFHHSTCHPQMRNGEMQSVSSAVRSFGLWSALLLMLMLFRLHCAAILFRCVIRFFTRPCRSMLFRVQIGLVSATTISLATRSRLLLHLQFRLQTTCIR